MVLDSIIEAIIEVELITITTTIIEGWFIIAMIILVIISDDDGDGGVVHYANVGDYDAHVVEQLVATIQKEFRMVGIEGIEFVIL